jgi:hypothetical protein
VIQYAVGYWGSHPDEENDDMWTGQEFDTLAEARAVFGAPVADSPGCPAWDVAFVSLDVIADTVSEYTGPDMSAVRANPLFSKARRARAAREAMAENRSEAVMQAGMMGGCDAANDESERWS